MVIMHLYCYFYYIRCKGSLMTFLYKQNLGFTKLTTVTSKEPRGYL